MSHKVQKYIKEGEIIARDSLLVLIFLTIIKAIAGLMTGIVVLYADALSSAADILSLFASYIGLKLSHKARKKGFQYGYYKVETFAALIASITILFLGYKIIRQSIYRLVDVTPGKYTFLGVIIVIISIFFSLRLSRKLMKAGEKANSLSLINNAKDKKMDVISAIAVFGGVVANYFKIPYLEGTIGIILSLLIFRVGFLSAKEALFFLLDYWDDYNLINKIGRVIRKEADIVTSIHKIRLRRAGTFIFGEAFLEINPFANMRDLRNDLNKLSSKIQEVNEHIKDFSIYEIIPQPQKIRIAVPIKNNRGLNSQIAKTLEATTNYLFVDIKKGKITQHKGIKFAFGEKDDHMRLADLLKKRKVNMLINNDLDSLMYFEIQHIQHIEIYPQPSNINSAEEIIKLVSIDT